MIIFMYKWLKKTVFTHRGRSKNFDHVQACVAFNCSSKLLSGRVIELVAPAAKPRRLYSLSFHSQHAMSFAR
jgi:hypothetical protein